MARYAKFFSVGGGAGPNGLQLPLGTVLDATLRQVQDGLGTNSPLYLSTGSVRIGTTAASAMYWDNTNNRLGIGTNAPTRQVELVGSVASPAYLALRYGTATGGGPVLALDAGSAGLNYLIISTTNSNGSVGANALGIYDGTDYRVVLKSGNLGIGEGTPTARLQVKGSGSTSATTSLLVQNSAGNRLLEQKDDGSLYIGNTASNTGTIFVPYSPTFVDRVFMRIDGGFPLFSTISNALLEISCSQFYTQGNMAMRNMNQGIIGQAGIQTNNSSIQLTTSVNAYNGTNQNDACNLLYVKNNGVTLQAGGSVNFIKLDGQVNEAGGGGVKFCTGIYYNPTLTGGSLLANSHYCYHATSGQMMVNTTSPNASAQLQVDSTTRGFLPPRVTTIQKNAISSPATGLMVFDTDLVRPCFFNGATWTTL